MEEIGQPAGPSCSEPRDTATADESDKTAEIVEDICSEASANEVEEEGEQAEEELIDDCTCFICKKGRKKFHGRWQPLHTSMNNSIADVIKSHAYRVDDVDMLEKMQDLLDSNRSLRYHMSCVTNYKNECNRQLEKKETAVSKHRKCYKLAYESICTFVDSVVILRKECCNSSRLRNIFLEKLEEKIAQNDLDVSSSYLSPWYLQRKLLDTYRGKIKIVLINNVKLVLPATGVDVQDIDFELLQNKDDIETAALLLRKAILSIEERKLPTNIKTKNIIEGECLEIPSLLTDFHCFLLSGQRMKNKMSDARSRLVQSFSEDVIYAVTNARLKTAKHLTLGMAIKSLTSSRKIVDISNRYGHCCSYTTVEEIETEVTFSSTVETQIYPEDIKQKPNLCTGLAFDNFDRYVETLTGKNTLHDTVGIIFQDIENEAFESVAASDGEPSAVPSVEQSRKKRRTFDAITPDLRPYQKKPKLIEILPVLPAESTSIPSSLKTHGRIRFAWMLSHLLHIENTPMWVGFNSLLFIDNSIKQKVSYLTTINQSPTSNHVVAEATVAQKVALECHKPYMQVTYDLAIAKIALYRFNQQREKMSRIIIISSYILAHFIFKWHILKLLTNL